MASPVIQLLSLRDEDPIKARDIKAFAEWVQSNRSTLLSFGCAASTGTTRRMWVGGSDTVGNSTAYPCLVVPYDGVIRNMCGVNIGNSGSDADRWTATLLRWKQKEQDWVATGVKVSVLANTSEKPTYGTGQLTVSKGDLLAVELTYSGTLTGITGFHQVSMELAAS